MADTKEVEVEIVREWTVVPKTPTPPEKSHLFLASLDLFWRDVHYNQRLLFYDRLQTNEDHVSLLTDSLSSALVHFYPWAGRLATYPATGRTYINCNDAGVEVVQASIDVPFSDLGAEFQFKPYFQQLVRYSHLHRSDNTQVPLLSVQITQFRGGGISVGVSQNHVVADGHSLWHFMVSWAECARGLPVSKPPIHDRTYFKLDNPSPSKAAVLIRIGKENSVASNTNSKAEPASERVFFFSADMIKGLKEAASKDGPGTYSSYEALCAHMWKSVTRARQLEHEQNTNFVVLMNCRGKMNPALPYEYFGNVVNNGMIEAPAGEVLEERLGSTAERIHSMIQVLSNPESLWAEIHYLELRDNYWDGPLLMDTWVASSPRFPVYEVDFGWGKPSAVRPSRCGGVCEIVLFPGLSATATGDVVVCLKLQTNVMDRLQMDPQFLPPGPVCI